MSEICHSKIAMRSGGARSDCRSWSRASAIIQASSPSEVKKASEIYAMPTSNFRAWEYWTARLEKSGNGVRPAGGKKSISAPRKRASVGKAKARKVKGRKR